MTWTLDRRFHPPIGHREGAAFMVGVMLTVACGRTPEPATSTTRDAAPPVPDASNDVERADAVARRGGPDADAADAVAAQVVDPDTIWTPPHGWSRTPPLDPARRCFLAPAAP